jgi:ferredoxin
VKVRIDATRCKAYGVCFRISPTMFQADEWGYSSARQQHVPPDLEQEVGEAMRQCPEEAIFVDES